MTQSLIHNETSLNEEIEKALDDLKINFMSMTDYEEKLKLGEIADIYSISGGEYGDCPEDHPLGKSKRKRINAADKIMTFKKRLPQKQLDIVHECLFDCCHIVRLSLATSLLYLGNESSVQFINKLKKIENESITIKNMAAIVAEILVNKKTFLEFKYSCYGFPGIYIGDIENGEANGKGKLYFRTDARLTYAGEFKNNLFHGLGVYFANGIEIGIFEKGNLIESAKDNYDDIISMFISMDGDLNTTGDDNGTTLLLWETHNNSKDKTLLLIEKGADVNIKNYKGATPLQAAANNNFIEIAKLLIENGANINSKDKDGWTPLYAAFSSNSIEAMILLIEEGADINAKNKKGNTVLYEAISKNCIKIAELLIEKGADVNIKSNDGMTALEIAQEKENSEIIELLKTAK